jgi:hypothetical protein
MTQHAIDTGTSKTFIQDVSIFNILARWHAILDAIYSKRCAYLPPTVGSLYHFDSYPPSTLKEAAPPLFIISTGCHTQTSSSYQYTGNAYHFDISYSFELEVNQVPSKRKVGTFVTSPRLGTSATPRKETRWPEMSVMFCNFGTQCTVSYERPRKFNPPTNWHHSDMAYSAQHSALHCFPFDLAALS